jgi:hypothetical protein
MTQVWRIRRQVFVRTSTSIPASDWSEWGAADHASFYCPCYAGQRKDSSTTPTVLLHTNSYNGGVVLAPLLILVLLLKLGNTYHVLGNFYRSKALFAR